LTPAERERLSFLVQSGAAHNGIPRAVLERAIDDAALQTDDIGKVRSFLAGQ
jgi:hypothetical protein